MFNTPILYKIIKVNLIENIDDNTIDCLSTLFGYFPYEFETINFIKKHNKDKNAFFIVKTYVFNPTHKGQANDNITESLYDYEGNLICKNKTHHFIIHHNDFKGDEDIKFTGRDDNRIKKDSDAWYYDEYEDKLFKCLVSEIPYSTEKCKQFGNLDYFDDSYLVYPYPLQKDKDNHQHILSSFMLTTDFVEQLLNEIQ